MKRGFILLFVLLFSVGFVLAANGWGDTNVGDDGDDAESEGVGDDVDPNIDSTATTTPVTPDVDNFSNAETRYTQDFYIALGVAGGGILLALLFIYLFFRRPKNRWKKKPVRNVSVVKKPNSKIVKG